MQENKKKHDELKKVFCAGGSEANKIRRKKRDGL